jgi:hypothetical protein
MRNQLLSLALAGLAGCAVDELALESTAGITFEEFAAETPREPGTGAYIVNWDLVLYGDDELRAFFDQAQPGALAIYNSGGTDVRWSATQRKQLTYCVSNTFGAHKQAVIDALRQAHDAGWETFIDVDFTYVPAEDATCTAANANVLFDVNPISGAKYTARAFFPNEARVHRNVLVDDTAFAANLPIPLTGVLAHELGHILGFRHEHIRPEATNDSEDCVEDDQFRGVTSYDAASVMHYPQCHGTSMTLAFTARDREGAVAIYGPPGSSSVPAAAPEPTETGSADTPLDDSSDEADGGGCTTGGSGASIVFALLALVFTRACRATTGSPRRSGQRSPRRR